MAEQQKPPKVKDTLTLKLSATAHPEATLPQLLKQAISIARTTSASVCFTWNTGKKKVDVCVSPEDTYQGAQRRVQRELSE